MQYNYQRRKSTESVAAGIGIGGSNPIRLQSMTNTPTLDTEACVEQSLKIAREGADLVRLTTQGEAEANNMANIKKGLLEAGCDIPVVADVHFNPKAAFAAALTCDKVRINPGNFVDAARTFRKLEFSDEEYAGEIERIRKSLIPFLELCSKRSVCVRLGVNHGSLSDRIMSRYGDTPEGMVESVMEYLRICREVDFRNIVISIKASNTVVMTRTVRLLVEKMDEEGMRFPLHLGVTEAGDGEDGRIKSAVGIGALLADGIGDTIRVSLTEDPEVEVPVARKLRDYIVSRQGHAPIEVPKTVLPGDARSHSVLLRGKNPEDFPIAIGKDFDAIPDDWYRVDASSPLSADSLFSDTRPILLSSSHANPVGEMASWIDRFNALGGKNPIIGSITYNVDSLEDLQIQAGADFGALLLGGYLSGIHIVAPGIPEKDIVATEMGILQATRLRITKTEYIACPSCGRTLFDLQQTLAEVKKATSHLKGLKIGVMGCIVNGPGEMADADYGYVGAGRGRVSIYRGKQLVEKNIPSEEALPRLLALIESDRNP